MSNDNIPKNRCEGDYSRTSSLHEVTLFELHSVTKICHDMSRHANLSKLDRARTPIYSSWILVLSRRVSYKSRWSLLCFVMLQWWKRLKISFVNYIISEAATHSNLGHHAITRGAQYIDLPSSVHPPGVCGGPRRNGGGVVGGRW